jgi:Helix-turn-helix domain
MEERNDPPTKIESLQKLRSNCAAKGITKQSVVLLLAFRMYVKLTTIEIRDGLDILSPAPRVQDLKKLGHDIRTISSKTQTATGKTHRIARYALQSGQTDLFKAERTYL